MSKGWKIALISLGSLVGLVVVVLVVVLCLVFTPSRLTKIVNSLASEYIACETRFQNVDLTLLSTFPDAGLKVEKVYLVNPTAGAPSDTVARVGSLTVGLDVKAFLSERRVKVHQLLLEDADVSLFISRDGTSNFDIFPSSDTADTDTASALPEHIDIEKVRVSGLNARYVDRRSGLDAKVEGLGLTLKGSLQNRDLDADLTLGVPHVAFAMEDTATGRHVVGALVSHLQLDAQGGMRDESLDGRASVEAGRVVMDMADSAGRETMAADLADVALTLRGDGSTNLLSGLLDLTLGSGTLQAGGTDMVNATLRDSKHDLLDAKVPFVLDLNKKMVALNETCIALDQFAFKVDGEVLLANESLPLNLDLALATDGAWPLKPLLAIVPEAYMGWQRGMELDGKARLEAKVQGAYAADSTMPLIDAHVVLSDGLYHQPRVLPYRVTKIGGDLTAHLDLGKGGKSSAVVRRLSAHTRGSKVDVYGRVDDLTGDMRVNAAIKGSLPLADALPMVPDTMPLTIAGGDADIDMQVDFRMSQLQKMALEKVAASGTVQLRNLDLTYDTLRATAPSVDLTLQLPAKLHKSKLADARVKAPSICVEMPHKGIKAVVDKPNVSLGVNNMMREQLAAAFVVMVGETEAHVDSMIVSLDELSLKGSIRMDSTQTDPLKRFNPEADLTTHSAMLYMPQLPDAVRLSQFSAKYGRSQTDIRKVQVKLGHSDFELYGTVSNLEDWLEEKAMLHADLNFTSNYADIDQLMSLVSGLGTDPETLEMQRKEDEVASEANPFIVPKNVDVTLHTHIKRSVAFGNDLNDVAGSLTVKDGNAILDQIGFVCKAATMQLTAIYRSPRPDDLFAAIDFHLLDIQIDELLDMIPVVDTLVPMLSAFSGNANFHLAGESYLFADYKPKFSTLLGSAAISGEDLVLMDNSSIASIAKLMRFKSWKERDNKIHIDSLSVEMTCFRKEIEVFPFLINMGSYSICASGKHTLDNTCAYHLELLKNPLLAKVGVDIRGSLSSPKISLGPVKYADFYKPEKKGVASKKAMELKAAIRQALEKNVR